LKTDFLHYIYANVQNNRTSLLETNWEQDPPSTCC